MLPAVLDSVPGPLRSLTSSRRRLAVATSTWVFLLGCSSESPSDTPGTSQSSGGSTTAGGMGGTPSSSSGGGQAIGGGGSGGAPVATPTGGGPVAPTPTF